MKMEIYGKLVEKQKKVRNKFTRKIHCYSVCETITSKHFIQFADAGYRVFKTFPKILFEIVE